MTGSESLSDARKRGDLTRLRQLAARFGGLIPPGPDAGREIGRKIDAEANAIASEATRLLGLTEATEIGRSFGSRGSFEECLAFLADLSGREEWAWLKEARDA